jgi:hypothetical protein
MLRILYSEINLCHQMSIVVIYRYNFLLQDKDYLSACAVVCFRFSIPFLLFLYGLRIIEMCICRLYTICTAEFSLALLKSKRTPRIRISETRKLKYPYI